MVGEKYIFRYVKDKHGQRRGIVVAVDKDKIGWSLCHTQYVEFDYVEKLDTFDKNFGLNIALARAVSPKRENVESSVPNSIRPIYEDMKERAKRYFK